MVVESESIDALHGDQVLLHLDSDFLYAASQYENELNHIRKLCRTLPHAYDAYAPLNNAGSLPLQRRFEVNAHTYPGAPAVKAGARWLSYGELDAQADALALHLQGRGLLAGSFCLVTLAPSLAEVRAILAILKAGAAYLQFSPDLTPRHQALVIDVLRPSFLFMHDDGDAAPYPEADALQVIRCDDEPMDLPHGWPDEAGIGSATPACAHASPAAGRGIRIALRTHRALACHERAPARASDAGDAGDGPCAYRAARDFWHALSHGRLWTIAAA